MGLLSELISKKFDTDHQQAQVKVDAYRAIIASQQSTPEAKEYALSQLLHTAGFKKGEQHGVGQLLGGLLGIKHGQSGTTPSGQPGQPQAASAPAAPPDEQPIPGGGPLVPSDQPAQPATPQIPPMPRRANVAAGAPAQPPQRPARMFMTPEEIGQAKLNVEKPELEYREKQQETLENLKQQHQQQLKALEFKHQETIETSKELSKLAAAQAAAGKLTGKEKQDWDTAKALVAKSGGNPNDTQQVQDKLNGILTERSKMEHDKEAESILKTQAQIGTALQKLSEQKKESSGLDAGPQNSPQLQARITRMAAQDKGMDLAAWRYLSTGQLPGLGLGQGAGAKKWAIVQRAGQLMQTVGLDPSDAIAYQANIKANSAALGKLTWTDASMKQFEGTVERNMQTAEKLNDQFSRTQYPFAKRLITAYRTGKGDPVTNNFRAQMGTIATEYAKVMQGSISATGATVNSDKEARDIINSYLSKGQVTELFALLRTDMQNRRNSIQEEKDELVAKIKSKPDTTPAENAAPASSKDPLGILK